MIQIQITGQEFQDTLLLMSALDIGDLSQPMLQPVLAYIVALALAENPTNGMVGWTIVNKVDK